MHTHDVYNMTFMCVHRIVEKLRVLLSFLRNNRVIFIFLHYAEYLKNKKKKDKHINNLPLERKN